MSAHRCLSCVVVSALLVVVLGLFAGAGSEKQPNMCLPGLPATPWQIGAIQ